MLVFASELILLDADAEFNNEYCFSKEFTDDGICKKTLRLNCGCYGCDINIYQYRLTC